MGILSINYGDIIVIYGDIYAYIPLIYRIHNYLSQLTAGQDLQLARAALRSQGAGGLFCRDALGQTVLHHAAQGKPQRGQVTRRRLRC